VSLQRTEISFRRSELDVVVSEMVRLADDADGDQWLNIGPDVNAGEVHTGSWLWRAFSSRGPVIPKVTWYPAHAVRDRVEPTQVGVAHATGAKAVGRLAEAGVEVPTGWVTVQDHTRRGLIFAVPPGGEHEVVVDFALRVVRVFSPFEFGEQYLATIWRR